MAVFEKLGIKIPNAILVDGATNNDFSEVVDFLEQYGDINQVFYYDSEFDEMLVVEYVSGTSGAKLFPMLPYTFLSKEGNKFYIQNLAEIYSTLGGSKTGTYLSDLKQIANMSGQDYAVVLGEMLSQIQQSFAQLHPAAPVLLKSEESNSQPPHVEPTTRFVHHDACAPVFPPSQSTLPTSNVASNSANASGAVRTPLPPSDFNPPGLQRYVVEHVVRTSDASLHASHRLRPFSGRVPRPNHEIDDPSVSDLQRTRLLRDNQLTPACDLVKHLSHDIQPEMGLQQLDSAFGTVQDGEELYAKFMDTYQGHIMVKSHQNTCGDCKYHWKML